MLIGKLDLRQTVGCSRSYTSSSLHSDVKHCQIPTLKKLQLSLGYQQVKVLWASSRMRAVEKKKKKEIIDKLISVTTNKLCHSLHKINALG